MTSDEKKGTKAGAKKGNFIFRQYIAGKSPNSVRAVRNFKAICKRLFEDNCRVELVDVLKKPMLALSDEVYVTPTLIKLSPPPILKIIGDLGEEEKVLAALAMEE